MSHTRTTPDSAVETIEPKRRAIESIVSSDDSLLKTRTTPKRRAIDSEEQKSIDFSDDSLLKNLPRPAPQPPIAKLMDNKAIQNLANILVLEKTPNLVQKAKEALGLIPGSYDAECVINFSNVVRETWPLLASGIRKAMYCLGNVIGLVSRNANHHSTTQRWASMKSDLALESSLANIKPAAATFEFDILRLFLCILIGYWGDKAELPKLDAALGRKDAFGFGYMINMIEMFQNMKLPPPKPAKDLVKIFSYEIKDAEDAKNVGRVRDWLDAEFVDDENVDVDDLFEKIESVLLSHVQTGEECGHFNGSKAIVDIRVGQPWSFIVSIKLVEEDVWF